MEFTIDGGGQSPPECSFRQVGGQDNHSASISAISGDVAAQDLDSGCEVSPASVTTTTFDFCDEFTERYSAENSDMLLLPSEVERLEEFEDEDDTDNESGMMDQVDGIEDQLDMPDLAEGGASASAPIPIPRSRTEQGPTFRIWSSESAPAMTLPMNSLSPQSLYLRSRRDLIWPASHGYLSAQVSAQCRSVGTQTTMQSTGSLDSWEQRHEFNIASAGQNIGGVMPDVIMPVRSMDEAMGIGSQLREMADIYDSPHLRTIFGRIGEILEQVWRYTEGIYQFLTIARPFLALLLGFFRPRR